MTGYIALGGAVVKLLGTVLNLGMAVPALGIAHSIALIVFTFLANGKTAASTNMILGYSAGGLGLVLGAWAAMGQMGAAEEEVEGEYYEDYYYGEDEYYYGEDEYYGSGDDYYGDDTYGYDYYSYGYYGDYDY